MIYTTLVQWHNYFQWVIFLYLPIIAALTFFQWRRQLPYRKIHEIGARISIALVHSQMLLGILLMTHSPKVSYPIHANSTTFFWSIVHPVCMMMGIIIVTLALMVVRKIRIDSSNIFGVFYFIPLVGS